MLKGREDDNIETIRKRFKVFLESSLPVIQYYEAKGKVRKVKIFFSSSFLLYYGPAIVSCVTKFCCF